MSDNTLHKTFADFSLTDKTLVWLSKQNNKYRTITSFVCVHLIGSGLLLGAGISDTFIQTAAAIVTLVTGVVATPSDFFITSFTDKPPLLKAWSWKMTIDHAGQAVKHALSSVIIVVENFFIGPERSREDFFKEIMEMERGRLIKMKLAALEKEKRKRTINTPVAISTIHNHPLPPSSPTSTYTLRPKIISDRSTPTPSFRRPLPCIPTAARNVPTTRHGVPPPPPPLRPSFTLKPGKQLKIKAIDAQSGPCTPVMTADKIHHLRSQLAHVNMDQILENKKNTQNPVAKILLAQAHLMIPKRQQASSSSSESHSGWDD